MFTDDTRDWKVQWIYTTETGIVQPISSGKQMSKTLQKIGIEKRTKGWYINTFFGTSSVSKMSEQYSDSPFSPHYPADRHCTGITIVIPNILTIILALKIGLGLMLLIVFMLSSMVMKIAPDHSLSLTVFPVSSAQPCFSPHRELVCFVELYCRRIVNSPELVKIPLLHIKFPILYNRLVPIPILINPTVSPHWLFVRESVKKRRGTTRSKERNIWPDELYFL